MPKVSEAVTARIDQRILRDILRASKVLKSNDSTPEEKLKAVGKLATIAAIGTIKSETLKQHAYHAVRQLD